MLKLSRITALILAFAPGLSCPSYAAFNDGNLGDVSIIVEGNNRTEQGYMEALVRHCLEKDPAESWEALDAGKLRQCVYDSRLFSSVDVVAEEPVIRVKVQERWTLIPIPNLRISGDEYSMGGFVSDSNFLGRGKMLAVGGSYASEGSSFFLFLSDPSVMFTDWKLKLRLGRGSRDAYAYAGQEKLYAMTADNAFAGIGAGYRLTPRLDAEIGIDRLERDYSALEGHAPPDNISMTAYEINIGYNRSNYKLYFSEGFSLRAGHSIKTDKSDDTGDSAETGASASLELNTVSDHALRMRASWKSTDSDDIRMSMTEGGRRGARGVQSGGLWYTEGLFLSMDYSVPISQRKYGTWTIGPFIDHGQYDPVFPESGRKFTSYGVGAYLFLNTVALPGIGIEAGRNEEFIGDFVSFSLGFSI